VGVSGTCKYAVVGYAMVSSGGLRFSSSADARHEFHGRIEMKILIMTDLEGVAGVLNAADYIFRNSRYYEEACELLTLEVSAAVEGAYEAGATEVIVVDGHGHGGIKRRLLHPRAKLLGGRPIFEGFGWMCDGTFAAAMSIGQHAKANTDGGHLCHTGSFRVEDESVNGVSVGEAGQWILRNGYFGVPVVMLSGDQAACDEVRALVGNIETAAVKWGIKRGSASGLTADENMVFNTVALHLSPDAARALIRERAFRAVKRIPEIAPLRLEPPYVFQAAVRPADPGGKCVSATVKSTDLLDLLGEGRSLAYRRIQEKIDGAGKGRATAKAGRKAPKRKTVAAKKRVKPAKKTARKAATAGKRAKEKKTSKASASRRRK